MAKQVLKYHDVQLYESDVALFTGSQWLNDNAINFYLQYLTQTVVPHDMLLMDPAVVSCLLHQCKDEDEYKELADGLDLKSKRICLIPVTDNVTLGGKSSHWSLLVYRNGDFQHFDSSSGHNKTAAQRVANSFKSILQAAGRSDELKDFTRVQEVQDAPQQQNSYDCGVYVLIAAEFISLQHKGEIEVMYLRDYATPQRVTALRMQMPKLIRVKMQVAIVQYDPQLGQVKRNLDYVNQMVASLCREDKIDILMLPEMAFTGYVFKSKADVTQVAEVAGKGQTFNWCRQQARRLQCIVTCGYVEKEGELLYNSMLVVSPDGELVCNPRKTFLYETDKSWATAGKSFYTWDCPWLGKTISFGICMDINPNDFKAPFSAYEFGTHVVENKSDLVLFACAWNDFENHDIEPYSTISYWAQRLFPVIHSLQKGEYVKSNCHFLCSNRIGTENGTFFVGSSCILSLKEPAIIAHAGRRTEELLRAEIPHQ
ncbi:ubiquitin1-specific protease [Plasmopara halstedii]|uniref:Ubiquitin1-specific protease n=1 Tax=Plasmopara halstedii TaxID=4781 RepID=A0A0P1A7P0_PLAHL|nr:ubiquitin1-specific protease [Plasmopara halstedii]CEG36357.1 ubiquitin1-specific protease [Plasmopara halstedii]|eukprot:XP_024572726.1 ubiquitin1-specific protease [Plasmopara halstedii]